jgi:anthranilate phosphoribosyltransferase
VNIFLNPEQVKECIEKVGIGFMFAPTFHKSMKHAAGPRQELGIRTIFNILGPLTNPANAKGQVLGVFDTKLLEPLANVLMNLGIERAMVIHGLDGMDEITTTAETIVSEVNRGEIRNFEITPEMYGIKRALKRDLVGSGALENADIIKSIFSGEKGPKRDIVLINSAAALYVGKIADSLEEGVRLSERVIDSGKAMEKLSDLREFTNNFLS